MAFETKEPIDFEWITWPRVRVLAGLAALRSEPEIAATLGVSHSTVRSTVGAIKYHTNLRDVRDIGRWWLETGPIWLAWAAKQAGVQLKPDGS